MFNLSLKISFGLQSSVGVTVWNKFVSACLTCEIFIGINYMILSTKNRATCWTTSPVERATTLQAREVGYSSRGPGQGCRGPGLSNNQHYWSPKNTTFCCASCKIGSRFKIKLSSFKLKHQMIFFWHCFKLAFDDGIQHQHTDKADRANRLNWVLVALLIHNICIKSQDVWFWSVSKKKCTSLWILFCFT